ncbi:MAG: TonB C-terminal domain-containing protein [Verrucomicrobiota bacterium]|nr:TonB C-terminal domain-containing protein [Verrucomicrobiota bacterium]
MKIVTAWHVGLLVAAGLGSAVHGCTRNSPTPIIPVGLILDASFEAGAFGDSAYSAQAEPSGKAPAPLPQPQPDRKPPARAISKTGSKPNVALNRLSSNRQSGAQPQPRPQIARRNMERLKDILNKNSGVTVSAGGTGGPSFGSPAGSPNVAAAIVDDEMRGLSLIRQTFYDAWTLRPSEDEVGKSIADVAFRFDSEGRILSRELARSSGHKDMDKSAMDAAGAVEQIIGFSEEFLRRHDYRLVVAFQLGEE